MSWVIDLHIARHGFDARAQLYMVLWAMGGYK